MEEVFRQARYSAVGIADEHLLRPAHKSLRLVLCDIGPLFSSLRHTGTLYRIGTQGHPFNEAYDHAFEPVFTKTTNGPFRRLIAAVAVFVG
jgi:hypothetical protein